MIVEDDPLIRQLYKEVFISEGHVVVGEAADGEEALKLFHSLQEKPDLIVLDYRMPKKNGLEVAQEIMESTPNAKILMISGDPTINQNIVLSCDIKFARKPVQMIELLKIISMEI
ncbi:MAG: response regulator transcription factor [Promethearchaeota archaeon]